MRRVMYRVIVLIFVVAFGITAFARDPRDAEPLIRIEHAIARGSAFLVQQQDADGAWRSTTYALLKDGTSLTPLVAWAIATDNAGRAARDRALRKVSTWFVREDRHTRLDIDLQYPVYAAGLSLSTWNRPEVDTTRDQIVAWADLIRSLQLNDENGWSLEDAQFGGWGYSHEPPRKPSANGVLSPLDEPNLSATVVALEGLAALDSPGPSTIAARRTALTFVSRCQNLRQADTFDQPRPLTVDAKFNDGGFHFMHDDPVRNKPGVAGLDSRGEKRFASYGSTTADGLRALLLCGVPPTDPRVIAARQWLLAHFEDGLHPGAYPTDRSSLKPALDFYYAASVARALQAAHVQDDNPLGQVQWASRLSERLIARQRNDGSWSNSAVDVREDDPLVATPFVLKALQHCHEELRHEVKK